MACQGSTSLPADALVGLSAAQTRCCGALGLQPPASAFRALWKPFALCNR